MIMSWLGKETGQVPTTINVETILWGLRIENTQGYAFRTGSKEQGREKVGFDHSSDKEFPLISEIQFHLKSHESLEDLIVLVPGGPMAKGVKIISGKEKELCKLCLKLLI